MSARDQHFNNTTPGLLRKGKGATALRIDSIQTLTFLTLKSLKKKIALLTNLYLHLTHLTDSEKSLCRTSTFLCLSSYTDVLRRGLRRICVNNVTVLQTQKLLLQRV